MSTSAKNGQTAGVGETLSPNFYHQTNVLATGTARFPTFSMPHN
ncbi:hypothetical protein [Sinomonas sp. ASV322]|nr:hypothetical protein [Sinomonas sp. ASV322]MDQ4503716.1 hypothetical protein [Sinomonas sp. ASV322]